MNRLFTRLRRDTRGVAAMEFALIFPILFVLHIAAVEALGVYQAQRAISHIASTIADITAQNRVVTDAELNDILSASISMIHPLPNVGVQQRISSLSANGAGAITVDWTMRRSYVEPAAPSVPSGYLGANESAIVSDVIYDYRPTFGLFLPNTIRFVRHAYVRPRLSVKVDRTP